MDSAVKAPLDSAVPDQREQMRNLYHRSLELDGREEEERGVEQVWKRCTGKKRNKKRASHQQDTEQHHPSDDQSSIVPRSSCWHGEINKDPRAATENDIL